MAGGAGRGNQFARAFALRAGLLHAEKALAHLHHAMTVAGGAGGHFGARFGPTALADAAIVPARDANLRVFASCRFTQCNFHRITQVAAPINLPATAALTAAALTIEHIAKNIAKSFGKSAKAFSAGSAAATHVRIYAGMAILVVCSTLWCIGKHLVSLFRFLEFFFSYLAVALIAVRVVLHRQLAVSFFDVLIAGVFGNAQRVVIVFFSHISSIKQSLLKVVRSSRWKGDMKGWPKRAGTLTTVRRVKHKSGKPGLLLVFRSCTGCAGLIGSACYLRPVRISPS